MRHLGVFGAILSGGAALLPATAVHAEIAGAEETKCEEGKCKVEMTAQQLLSRAEALVNEKRFGEAAPLLAALENAPEFRMETQFLTGFSAAETGDLDGAIKSFRAALVKHPEQTRIRLELARALMLKGKNGSAEHHFRLAAQDKSLPEDILRTINASRGILRGQKAWSFNVDFGLAPDTNITNGTNAATVDANFGGLSIPFTLSDEARQKSGTGQTFGLSGSARLKLGGDTRLAIDADTTGVNYKGKRFDDFNGQLSVGPAFKLSERATLTVQGLANQRYYGGQRAVTGLGGRTSFQLNIDDGQRIGLSLDARRQMSGFSNS